MECFERQGNEIGSLGIASEVFRAAEFNFDITFSLGSKFWLQEEGRRLKWSEIEYVCGHSWDSRELISDNIFTLNSTLDAEGGGGGWKMNIKKCNMNIYSWAFRSVDFISDNIFIFTSKFGV